MYYPDPTQKPADMCNGVSTLDLPLNTQGLSLALKFIAMLGEAPTAYAQHCGLRKSFLTELMKKNPDGPHRIERIRGWNKVVQQLLVDIKDISAPVKDNQHLFPFDKSTWESEFWPRLEEQGVVRKTLARTILQGSNFSKTYVLMPPAARDAVEFLVQAEEKNGRIDPVWCAHFFPYDPKDKTNVKSKLDDIFVMQGVLGWSNADFAAQIGISHGALGDLKKGNHSPTLETYAAMVRLVCQALPVSGDQPVADWIATEANFFPCNEASKTNVYQIMRGLGLSFYDVGESTGIQTNNVNHCFKRTQESRVMFADGWKKIVDYVRDKYDEALEAYGKEDEDNFRALLYYRPDTPIPNISFCDLQKALQCGMTLGGILDRVRWSGVPQGWLGQDQQSFPIARVINAFHCEALGDVANEQVLVLHQDGLKIFNNAAAAYHQGLTMGGHCSATKRMNSRAGHVRRDLPSVP